MANLYHNVASKDVLNSTEIKEDFEIVQQMLLQLSKWNWSKVNVCNSTTQFFDTTCIHVFARFQAQTFIVKTVICCLKGG